MSDHEVLTVHIELIGSDPLIWRKLEIPSSTRLDAAGHVLQIAMGWENCHLQGFHNTDPYQHRPSAPDEVSWYEEYSLADGLPGELQEKTTLGEAFTRAGSALYFEYDFGDCWMHRLTVESSRIVSEENPMPKILGGAMRAPIEDSGGIGGWYEKLPALASSNPTPEQQEIIDWMHWRVGPEGTVDPAAFDLESCNRRIVARYAGLEWNTLLGRWLFAQEPLCREFTLTYVEKHGLKLVAEPGPLPDWFIQNLMRPYQELITLCQGDGIKLTAAGWIPPVKVGELVANLNWEGIDYESSAKKLESNMPTVMMLRESATTQRLVRKYNGRLVATKLGQKLSADPNGLAKHLLDGISAYPGPKLEQDEDMANWLSHAIGAVRHSTEANEFQADFMNVLGYLSGRTRMSLTKEDHVYFTTTSQLLENLATKDLPQKYPDPKDSPRQLRFRELAHLILHRVVA